jgi:hypothetical protein
VQEEIISCCDISQKCIPLFCCFYCCIAEGLVRIELGKDLIFSKMKIKSGQYLLKSDDRIRLISFMYRIESSEAICCSALKRAADTSSSTASGVKGNITPGCIAETESPE